MDDTLSEQTLEPRIVKLTTRTGIDIRRTLPHRQLRMIGAWCFIDHYGPTDAQDAMSVAAHPHVGLQTVSWLFSGLIEHRDSIGSRQLISPGELNIMTAGHGIAHSELSITPPSDSKTVHGVQLWTALPSESRDISPAFEHLRDLPFLRDRDSAVRVFVGEFMGMKSNARMYSPLLGAEIVLQPEFDRDIKLNAGYEYGILVVEGDLLANESPVQSGQLHYIPTGSVRVHLKSPHASKFILLGGEPFSEKILMWWNFIGRNKSEIERMRNDWNFQSERFPSFPDRIGGRIPAPEIPNVGLTPRGNSR